jgi:hypothetical protein
LPAARAATGSKLINATSGISLLRIVSSLSVAAVFPTASPIRRPIG